MKRPIRNAEDLAWLVDHTHAFRGGQVTELHLHKQRLLDEVSGREVTAGTTITAVIRYEFAVRGSGGLHALTRVAKLTMRGATDFSIFEQEGADCSEIGAIHAEASGGRLRFWFDPHGELYVICDEAEIEEVSRPSAGRPLRAGMTEWTFQAQTGELPAVAWFLDHLDRAGLPCAWRAVKRSAPSHPALRWEGHLVPAAAHDAPRSSGVQVQTYGPLDGCDFVIILRASNPHEDGTGRLLVALADIIARSFAGTCLAGNHIMERDEWLGVHNLGWSARLEE
ncbi:MAG: hypothetical protein HY581_02770 [Nitrospirae bacterium]|nr:hypothetical protein [Nitrospirota bacterium]